MKKDQTIKFCRTIKNNLNFAELFDEYTILILLDVNFGDYLEGIFYAQN